MAEPVKTQQPKKANFLALCALCGTALATSMVGDIRTHEGRVYHSYKDIGGIVTGCDGDTHNVRMGQTFTDGECDDRTARQLLAHAKVVLQCSPTLREVGNENYLRAYTDMDYNTGAFCKGWFRDRPSPAKLFNSGKKRESCLELLQYDLVKGKHIRGLANRRHNEVYGYRDKRGFQPGCLAGVGSVAHGEVH